MVYRKWTKILVVLLSVFILLGAVACDMSNGQKDTMADGTKDQSSDANTDTGVSTNQSEALDSTETEIEDLEIVTETIVIEVAEEETEPENSGDPNAPKGVTFLRLDGLNAAGESIRIYGDFSGDADADDLTDIVWEKSDSFDSGYTAVAGATATEYTPSEGGYYLRASAKFNGRKYTTKGLYIREEANNSFVKGYLSADGDTLNAAIVYHNELSAIQSKVRLVVYQGDRPVKIISGDLKLKNGSDAVVFTCEIEGLANKRVEMTVCEGDNAISETVSVSEELPSVKISKSSAGASVYIGKKKIAYFQKNRYMQFRSTVENDHWIGTEHNPIDMGFAYQESGVAGLNNIDVQYICAPGMFKIVFIGEKANVEATQRNELIGFWDAEKEEFAYIYNCSMTADTESWHSKSNWASQGRIEAFDYHLERMSILDRVYNKNEGGDLYDYVIYENGKSLVRIPKLPVPRTAISGTYFYGFFLSPGESVFYPDANEGGWKSTVLSDSGDTYVEICWSWYDIHSCSENSVPRVGSCSSFTVSQSWLFETTAAEHDAALIDKAIEVEWQDLPNYQLPLFSTDNTFETQFGGTDWQYAWWKSTYDCTMDAKVGHNGAGSVKIENKTSKEASWYTEGVWGYPYSFDQVQGKTYRVSGYIKAENVVGEAYIANIQYQHATPNDNTVTKSESISGTTDWVYVSFTFVAQERKTSNGSTQRCIDHFFLTLKGTGTVWFDDVKIEEVK